VYSSFREDDTYFNLTDTRFLFEDTRIKIVLFESEIDVPDIFKDERQRNMYKQWFKLQRLFSSVPATYDTYVRIRPDVRLTRPGQLETLLTNQTTTLRIPIGNDRSDINTITKDHFPAINDQVCIASYDGMAHYCKVINHLMPFEGSPADRLSGFLSEQVLAAHLSMPVERVVLDYKLVLSSVKVVAISGDSGSGKSTLCSLIRPLFLFDKVLEFETDRYHKWERNDEHWKTTSHLDPTSNYLEKLEEDTFNLKLGNSIIAVDYDHSTGRFTAPQTVTSNDNVILCGLHTLYSESMRGLTDIKIFMDTDPELSTEWKIQRDVNQRGYPIESVLQKINERRLDYNKFILPQKDHADVIIRHVKEGLEVLVRRIFSLPAISGCVITHTTTHSVLTCKDPHITVESEISAFLAERSLPKIKSQPGYSGVIQLVILAILYK
jgi:uridine kinase